MMTIFDVETSGFLVPNYPPDHPKQGRILQIGALLVDYDFNERGAFCVYIKVHDKLEISEGAYEAHGITLKKCNEWGVPMEIALLMLEGFFNQSEYTVAHNHAFDRRMVSYEDMVRFGNAVSHKLDFKLELCTMIAARKIVTIIDKRRVGLEEVYFHLFGETLPKEHDALIDCRRTLKILQKLLELKHVNECIPPVRILPSTEEIVQTNS